jgi:hypothetical protein
MGGTRGPRSSRIPLSCAVCDGSSRRSNQTNGGSLAFASDGGAVSGSRLDVDDFCCPDYLKLMVDRIRSKLAASGRRNRHGPRRVHDTARDGSIVNVRTERSSGDVVVDSDAVRAVFQTGQLPELPVAFPKPTLTHLNFHAAARSMPPDLIADAAASQVYVPGQDKDLTLPRVILEVKPE